MLFTAFIVGLNILLNDSWNQTEYNITFLVDTGNNEADFILFTRHAVIVAAVRNSVDTDFEAYKDGAFVDVSNNAGIFLAVYLICYLWS